MEKKRFLLVSIYRPPDTNISTFISELSDLLDIVAGRYSILTGDFNCPGVTCDCVDTRLTAAITCHSLTVVNEGPTRLNYDGGLNKLDVVIEAEDGGHLCDVSTVSTGFSDHSLLKAHLNCGFKGPPMTRYSYHDIRNMDVDGFRARLRSNSNINATTQGNCGIQLSHCFILENSASGSTDKTHRYWQHGFLQSLQRRSNQRRL